MFAAVGVLVVAVTAGCSGSSGTDDTTAAGPITEVTTGPPEDSGTTVEVIWEHTGEFFDETQVWYVARITNHGDTPASIALSANALDDTGTIIGSQQPVLPNISPGGHFDYFGFVGGGGLLNESLTGEPVELKVSEVEDAFGRAGAVAIPLLETSEVEIDEGNADTYTDAPLSYNMTAKVTNTTGNKIVGGVTQQVILYTADGDVVGGSTGSSDNVPETLPDGASYREKWTGIPAIDAADTAEYSAWPG